MVVSYLVIAKRTLTLRRKPPLSSQGGVPAEPTTPRLLPRRSEDAGVLKTAPKNANSPQNGDSAVGSCQVGEWGEGFYSSTNKATNGIIFLMPARQSGYPLHGTISLSFA